MSLLNKYDNDKETYRIHNEPSKAIGSSQAAKTSRRGKQSSQKVERVQLGNLQRRTKSPVSRKPRNYMTLDAMLNRTQCETLSSRNHRRPSLDSLSLLTSGTTDLYSLEGPIITTPFNDETKNKQLTSSDLSVNSDNDSLDHVEMPVVTSPRLVGTKSDSSFKGRPGYLRNDTTPKAFQGKTKQITNFSCKAQLSDSVKGGASSSSNNINPSKKLVRKPITFEEDESTYHVSSNPPGLLECDSPRSFFKKNSSVDLPARKVEDSGKEKRESEEDRMMQMALEMSLRDVETVQGQTEKSKQITSSPKLSTPSLEEHLSLSARNFPTKKPGYKNKLNDRRNSGFSNLSSGTEDVVTEVILENHFGVSRKQVSCRDLNKFPSTAIDRYNFKKPSETKRSIDRNHMSHLRRERSQTFNNTRKRVAKRQVTVEQGIQHNDRFTGIAESRTNDSLHPSTATNWSLDPIPAPTKIFQNYEVEHSMLGELAFDSPSNYLTTTLPLRGRKHFTGNSSYTKPFEMGSLEVITGKESKASSLIPKSEIECYKEDVMKMVSSADTLEVSGILYKTHDNNEPRKTERRRKEKNEKNDKRDIESRKKSKEEKRNFLLGSKRGRLREGIDNANLPFSKPVDDVIDSWFSGNRD